MTFRISIKESIKPIEEVHSAAKELIRTFNQSSVLIQANQTETEFYSGD